MAPSSSRVGCRAGLGGADRVEEGGRGAERNGVQVKNETGTAAFVSRI